MAALRERAAQIKREQEPTKATPPCDACTALGAVTGLSSASNKGASHALDPELTRVLTDRSEPPPSKTKSSESSGAPDIVELGRASWTLLHSIAAYYPLNASPDVQGSARAFLESFAKLFPCKWCARDLEAIMSTHPPQLQGRAKFSNWLCEAHNEINEQLGKPQFDCSKVEARWRKPGVKDEDE